MADSMQEIPLQQLSSVGSGEPA